jgi:hypothetical protein
MSWKRDRDSLIAQTMAFVQSVTGRKEEAVPLRAGFAPVAAPVELPAPPALDSWVTPKAVVPVELIAAVEPQPRTPAPTIRPAVAGEMANEIRARIAGFRAHQERFNREREQYFSQTLAKLKAEINEMPPPRADK